MLTAKNTRNLDRFIKDNKMIPIMASQLEVLKKIVRRTGVDCWCELIAMRGSCSDDVYYVGVFDSDKNELCTLKESIKDICDALDNEQSKENCHLSIIEWRVWNSMVEYICKEVR